MARFKLPESMKAWKVVSSLPDNNGNSVYEVSRKETDGSVTNAVMTYVAFQGDDYNSDNVQFINEEAAFIRNVINCGEVSNYIDAAVLDKPSKSKIGMFIITQKLTSLEQTLMQKKSVSRQTNMLRGPAAKRMITENSPVPMRIPTPQGSAAKRILPPAS